MIVFSVLNKILVLEKRWKISIFLSQLILYFIGIYFNSPLLISANIVFLCYPFFKLTWEKSYKVKNAATIVAFFHLRILSYLIIFIIIWLFNKQWPTIFKIEGAIIAILIIYLWQVFNI